MAAALSDTDRRPVLTGRRVLVVEDDADVRRMLATVLQGSGAVVVEASSGAAGLRAVAESAVDAVVLDWNLDDMPATAFLASLDETETGLRTRTAVITGDLIRHGAEHEAEHLGLPLVRKPFRPAELTTALARLLSQQAE